jgi:undecaprenyl-phosphate galactose phosphotransferase
MQYKKQIPAPRQGRDRLADVVSLSEFVGGEAANTSRYGEVSSGIGLSSAERFLKRVFDIVSVVVMVVLFGPVMVVIALAIAMSSSGQVIFRQTRVGRNGKQFTIYKFRSMVANSGRVLEELLESSPDAKAEWERDFKLKNDPRVTRIGRFVRQTSLDELPQLWNVLRGDMSIVGPRPVLPEELERHYGSARDHYLSVAPGLTGLWQVSGRNDLGYEQRVWLDRCYVETWNLVTDFTIVMRTVSVMFGRRGAY